MVDAVELRARLKALRKKRDSLRGKLRRRHDRIYEIRRDIHEMEADLLSVYACIQQHKKDLANGRPS